MVQSDSKEVQSSENSISGKNQTHNPPVSVPLRLLSSWGGSLSSVAGWAAGKRWPVFFMTRFLKAYSRFYQVNLAESEKPIEAYPSFVDFFTRSLKPGLRSFDPDPLAFSCPVDGALAGAEQIVPDALFQAKGLSYRLEDLLAETEWARKAHGGHYFNLYLSPRDYHHFHAPADLKVTHATHIPGKLLPVNNWSRSQVSGLYAGNERIAAHAVLSTGKSMWMVFVAATVVGKVRLRFDASLTTHNGSSTMERKSYGAGIPFRRGEAMGCFELGSTVLLFTEPGALQECVTAEKDTPVLLGQTLAKQSGLFIGT